MSVHRCRWGILGTASIARKNWRAIRHAQGAELVGVASRDIERARAFIAECQAEQPVDPVPRAYGSYEELLASDDVDAVYIPLPTGMRAEWAIRAAKAGKHVLGEKPAACDAGQVREILQACQEHRVQYMDGVMFMHSRRLERMRQALKDPSGIGPIRRIDSAFSFLGPEEFRQQNIRVHSDLEPLGALGDLGWYNLRLTLWAMDWRMPRQVRGELWVEMGRSDSPGKVPVEFSATLHYDDGVSASFFCSFLAAHQQWAVIGGTQGYVHVGDFVLPYFGSEVAFTVNRAAFQVSGCDFNMEDHSERVAVHEYSNSAASAQETRMIERFSELALGGSPDPFWGEIALKTQMVLDACLASARAGGEIVEINAEV